jgi:hypothetical protein
MSFRKIGWKKLKIKTVEKDYKCRKALWKIFEWVLIKKKVKWNYYEQTYN